MASSSLRQLASALRPTALSVGLCLLSAVYTRSKLLYDKAKYETAVRGLESCVRFEEEMVMKKRARDANKYY